MSYRAANQTLKPEWIDHNGHLNMAYYVVLFDWGVDEVQEVFGLGVPYSDADHPFTTFSAEFRIRYVRELPPGSTVYSIFRLLDVGPKAYHFCQELYHEDGWLSATGEGISLHVDRTGPKVVPYPPEVLAKMEAMLAEHSKDPVPDWVGRPMGIRK
ncbi:thioesterase [Oceanicola sp. 22II-s10i]|uniref:thioesterase family protein n=1 Tax=Oceanicola sp. 22II-s10i TaxID=1317116 RepID=UPI000B526EC9|nr:thioesterase family protein [Oceanicola sp. 22II-s10i]OWU84805.1 thioesterase [Oceanicola sp. 22II-s10i]